MASGGRVWDRDPLRDLLRTHALRLGDFTLASGKRSHYYIDGRVVTLSAAGAWEVASGIWDILRRDYPQVRAVGGLTMGADPIVGAVLATAGLLGPDPSEEGATPFTGFLVRKQVKTHGTGKRIEGALQPGTICAIVDDVATTGGSAIEAIHAVREFGAVPAVVIVMLDRLEGAEAAFQELGAPFRALFTIRDLGVEPQASS